MNLLKEICQGKVYEFGGTRGFYGNTPLREPFLKCPYDIIFVSLIIILMIILIIALYGLIKNRRSVE